MTETSRKRLAWGYVTIALLAFVLCRMYDVQPDALLLGSDRPAQVLSWREAAALLAFAAAFASSVFFSVPVAPLFYVASGYLFGVAEGTIVAVLATTSGSLAAFHFFRKTVRVPPAFRKIEIKNLFLVLLLLRSSPWFPSPLINVYCGVTRTRVSTFVASTLLGTLPLICVYTLAASRLRGHVDASLLYSPEIVASLVVLSVISVSGLLPPLRIVASHLHALRLPA